MIACFFDPGSCIPEWITFVVTYWDRLLAVLFVGMILGGLGGWKLMVIAISGLFVLVTLRGKKDDDYPTELPKKDALPVWRNRGKFQAPILKRRTAKRSPPMDTLTK